MFGMNFNLRPHTAEVKLINTLIYFSYSIIQVHLFTVNFEGVRRCIEPSKGYLIIDVVKSV